MFTKKVYHYPCLMTFVAEMENLMVNDIDGILCFLNEIEKMKYFQKFIVLS